MRFDNVFGSIKMVNKVILNIDGNIGAGKSSFIKRYLFSILFLRMITKMNQKVKIIEENVDRDTESQKLLKNYYLSPSKYAFQFQCWILKDKYEQQLKLTEQNSIIIFDRSYLADRFVFCDLQYKLGNITTTEYEKYCQIYDQIVKDSQDSINIYIHCEVETCLKRIAKRSRDGESKISEQYLKNLEEKYLKIYKNLPNTIFIDGNGSMKDMDKSFEEIFAKINI